MKKSLLCVSLLAFSALLVSCSGTFDAAEATAVEINANGVNVQIASANGESGYDEFVDALSGAVYKGSCDDCHFGDVCITMTVDGEEKKLYPCTDDDCGYIAIDDKNSDKNSDKYNYLKVSDDDRKVIFDFINEYAY